MPKITDIHQVTPIEILRVKGFINAIDDGDGEILTDFPIYIRIHKKSHLSCQKFFSAEEFSNWANKIGCKTRSCGPNVIWEEIPPKGYLNFSQYVYYFEEVSEDVIQFEQQIA